MNRRTLLKGLGAIAFLGISQRWNRGSSWALNSAQTFEVTKTDEQWRAVLTPEQYWVLRQEGTEAPFKNRYHDFKAKGTYDCAGCDQKLFSWRHKYDSGTGWPSFWQPMFSDALGTRTDWKLLFPRTEVHCARCGGHLGHLFDDGPEPTYRRYCINSAALTFQPAGD